MDSCFMQLLVTTEQNSLLAPPTLTLSVCEINFYPYKNQNVKIILGDNKIHDLLEAIHNKLVS